MGRKTGTVLDAAAVQESTITVALHNGSDEIGQLVSARAEGRGTWGNGAINTDMASVSINKKPC